MKKMSTSKKLLIVSLIIFILAIGFVGTASIFAEPSLEDLINSRVYGTYTPNFWYDDGNTSTDDWTVTGVIKSTDIVVDYSIWTDYNDDGLVNMLDVYSQEGYQFKFLVNEFSLPVLRIHPNADYYIVKMSELDQIDQVVAAVEIANNNDNAEMKSQKDYYFDKDTNILYLGANLVNEMENGRELRIQTTSIVHNIDNFTKEFAVITGFSEDITNNPLKERVPYGVFRRSVKDWLTSGLTINLVQPEHLAYVSTSDLQVFVNEQETTDFRYDETTGILSFPNQSPYEINNIIVYFKSLKNVSKYDATLQYAQCVFGNETAQAIGWDNMSANRICRHVAFSEEPKIGNHEPLDFYAFVYDDIPSATSGDYTVEFDNMNVANLTIFDHEKVSGSVSESDIKRAIASAYDTSTINVDTSKGITNQMNDVLTLWRPYQNGQDEVNKLFEALGDMTANYMVSDNTHQQEYLQKVVEALNPLSVGENSQLMDKWQYWDNNVQAINQCVGMYIVGHTNGTTNLLGGTVTSGWPYFTVGCCQINVANSYNPEPTITKSDTHQTSISIINKDANFLYVCISPVSLGDSNTLAYQRLCGFTKIAYTYTGTGSASFSKIDERGALLGGADYELHIATKSGSSYTYIDSQYSKYGFPKDITSSDIKPIVVTDLPYITGDTWYVIVEKTPPVGFMRDTKQYPFKIDSTHINQSIIATDTRQYATFILQVFDATTEGFPVPHPVQGLKFNMYDESGNIACQYNSKGEIITTYSNLITDANGRITVRVYPGTYYFRQLETVENYWLDYYATRKEENCNYILAEMPADRSGQELRFGTTHYEKRQTATILTQVQDVSMQEKTPAILGGEGEGYVETINGQWELHVSGTDYITVGYRDNGTAVRISKDDGALMIQNEGVTTAGTSFNKNGQSYLSASHIKVEGTVYPIPNGNYYWKLKSAPKGYVSNSAVSNVIDASWKVENNQIDVLALNSDVAPLTRQTMSLNTYAKGYDKTSLAAAYSYDIAKYNSYTYKSNTGFEATQDTIELKSNSKNVSNTSKEQANCNYEGASFTVEAGVVVPNTIYQLQNQKAIVSMNGGVIAPNTILGRYISDDKGHLTPSNSNSNVITTFGSPSIDNPNTTSKDYITSFGAISVVDNKGQGVNGTNLPNGEYVLSVIMPADEYEIETIFENTPFVSAWDSSKSNIDVNVTTLLYHAKNTVDDKGIVNVGMFLAASPIANNPKDPYDPQHPDNGSVDDSEDIPTATVDWIIAHTNDKAYRTVDDANVTVSESGVKTYDTQDTVPTTFATTFKDSTESKWNTTYELYFYYEISKATYDAATNKDKWNYRTQEINGETHYFQRFAVPGSSSNGNLLLEDFIVFNKAAQDSAYDNGVTTIKRNLPLSGAVYNTMWLNSQMVDPSFNGTYYIAAGVLITREKVNEVSGINMRKQEFTDNLALLTIKSRQLFALD